MKYALALLALAAPLQAQVMRQNFGVDALAVSSAAATYCNLAGCTMTGNLTVPYVNMTGSGGNAFLGTGDGELTAAGANVLLRLNRTGANASDFRIRTLADGADLFTAGADFISFSPQSAEAGRFNASGLLGIGSTSPAAKLHVSSAPSATENVILADGVTAGSPGIATTGTLAQGTVGACATGVQTTSTGAFTSCVASDIRLKTNILPLKYNPDLVGALRPITYQWKDKGGRDAKTHYGFVAQEVEKVAPHAIVAGGGNGLKGLDANAMTALLLAEVQALRKRLDALENK